MRNETKVNTNPAVVSLAETKKLTVLVTAPTRKTVQAKRAPRPDLRAQRDQARDSMLSMTNFLFSMLSNKLFRPVDMNAPRDILDLAPVDDMAMRLHPAAEAQIEELRRQVVDLVRNAPMVRGKASRQAFRLVGGGNA